MHNKALMKDRSDTYTKIRFFFIVFILIQPLLDCYFLYTDQANALLGFTVPPLLSLFYIAVLLLCLFVRHFKDLGQKSKIWLYSFCAISLVYFIVHHLTNTSFNSMVPNDFNYSFINEAYYIIRLMVPFFIAFIYFNIGITKTQFYQIIYTVSATIAITIVVTNLFCISLSSYTNEWIKGNLFDWFNPSLKIAAEDLTSKGIFSYANQTSAILMFTLPLLLYNCLVQFKWWKTGVIFVQAISMIMLGTKTATLGLILVFIFFIIAALFSLILSGKFKKIFTYIKKNSRFAITFTLILLVSLAILPKSPALAKEVDYNQYVTDQGNKEKPHGPIGEEEKVVYHKLSQKERVKFIKENYKSYSVNDSFILKAYPYKYDPDFWYGVFTLPTDLRLNNRYLETAMIKRVVEINNDAMDRFFGISATRETNIFKIERDYLAQYYSIGLVGLLIFMIPVPLIGVYFGLTSLKKKYRKDLFENVIIAGSLFIILGIGYVSGNCLDNLFTTVLIGFAMGYMLFTMKFRKTEDGNE